MFGFLLYLLYLAGKWVFGSPFGEVYPDATSFLFRWYVVWAMLGVLYYLVNTLLHAAGKSTRKEGSLVGSFLSRGLLHTVVWFLQYAPVLLGAYLLGLGLVAGVWMPLMILAGLLLLLMGWVIQTILLITYIAD